MEQRKDTNLLSKLSSHSIWYFIGGILNNGLSILLLPFLSRMLTPSEYGIVQTANSIGVCLPIFFSFYIESAFARFYHDIKEDKEKVQKLFSTCFWFVILSGLSILSLLTYLSPFWFEKIFNISPYPYVFLVTYPYLFYQISMLGSTYLRQVQSVKLVSGIDVISSLTNLGLSIYLVSVWNNGVQARLFAIAIAFSIKAIFYICFFSKIKMITWHINFISLKALLKYSIPLAPSALSLWLSKMADRIIISIYVGTAATGIFSAANQISFIVYFVQDAVLQALSPIQMEEMIKNKPKAILSTIRLSKIMWIFMLLVVLFMGLFSNMIMTFLIGEKYEAAAYLIIVLSTVYALQAQYRIFSGILIYHKKSKEYSYAAILQAILSVSLNLLLIPILGFEIAAYTLLVSMSAFLFLILFYVNRLERLDYNYSFYLRYFFLFLLAIALDNVLADNFMGVYRLLFKASVFFMTILLSYKEFVLKLKEIKED